MLPHVNLRLSVPLVILFVLLWAGVVILFWQVGPAQREAVKFAAEFLGGAAAIYALFLNVQAARNAAARRFIERWTDPTFAAHRKAISDMVEKGDLGPSPDRQALLAILNFWEEIAVAVLWHEADEDLLQDFFYSAVIKSFGVTEGWIKKERVARNQPSGYIRFENLYNRWRSK